MKQTTKYHLVIIFGLIVLAFMVNLLGGCATIVHAVNDGAVR
jgi:hypothetical protein